MIGAIIHRNNIILKKEKVYLIAPLFLLAGFVAEFACYILAAGFILSILTNKDFKYNIEILMHSIIESRREYVLSKFAAMVIYIPIFAVALNALKALCGLLFKGYTYVFDIKIIVVSMLIAISVLSILYYLSIKLGPEVIGVIFTLMMMGFSAMGIFQKSIDLANTTLLGIISLGISIILIILSVKTYESKDF